MKLLEYQGKALFARNRIPVPGGALWPAVPEAGNGYVIKAQVPAGGRGKGGGIRFAASLAEAGAAAAALRGAVVAGHVVDTVWVERRLDIVHEYYLAVVIDRDARCRAILAGRDGGVDVEGMAENRLLRIPVNPLAGLLGSQVRRVAEFLNPAVARTLARVVAALYRMAVAGDAELAEINPLALTAQGTVVAADAKVVLDGRAAFRHPDWADTPVAAEGSPFERAIAAAGGVAVEVAPAGDLVAVVSGAGLMMATFDGLVDLGARVRAVVDMQGTPLVGGDAMVPIMGAVASLKPRATFLNAFFHTAHSDRLAYGVAEALDHVALGGRKVARLEGRGGEAGRAVLASLGFEVHGDLEPALAAAAAASRRD